jgi:predicted secreted protein
MNTIIVRKDQDGQKIRVKPGDIIQVELSFSGGTGYAWYFDKPETDVIETLSEETKINSQDGKIGAPGIDIRRFKAIKAGYAEVRLNYYRKWEGKEKSADHFSLAIEIIQNGDR